MEDLNPGREFTGKLLGLKSSGNEAVVYDRKFCEKPGIVGPRAQALVDIRPGLSRVTIIHTAGVIPFKVTDKWNPID